MPQQTTRRSLVPRAAVVAVTVSLAVITLAVFAGVLVVKSGHIEVPDVVGVTAEIAESRVLAESLAYEVTGTQVSVSVPEGSVISQSPPAGTIVSRNTVVGVVISVGLQTISVPDLVGLSVDEATVKLEELGLKVAVEKISSEVTSTIVLEMYPAPGATVSVGDEVRLSIPGGSTTDVLLPYDLEGLSIVLDPLPLTASDGTDVSLDVARRLQALLQAGGATVTMTRSATETASTPVSRAAAARASGATVLVGIDLGKTGTPGLRTLHAASVAGDPARTEESVQLAQSITRMARLPGFVVNEPLETTDVIVAGFPGTGVRVVVADSVAESDRARMLDPNWADLVARAIYRGIGSRLGAE